MSSRSLEAARARRDGGKGSDDRPLDVRIVEALARGPKTKTALSKALGRNKSDLEEAITSLFQRRSIETTTLSVRNRTFNAFQLRRTPDFTPDAPHVGLTPDVSPDDTEAC